MQHTVDGVDIPGTTRIEIGGIVVGPNGTGVGKDRKTGRLTPGNAVVGSGGLRLQGF
jgi:hypothetical protein